jgi:hypothetical protein
MCIGPCRTRSLVRSSLDGASRGLPGQLFSGGSGTRPDANVRRHFSVNGGLPVRRHDGRTVAPVHDGNDVGRYVGVSEVS